MLVVPFSKLTNVKISYCSTNLPNFKSSTYRSWFISVIANANDNVSFHKLSSAFWPVSYVVSTSYGLGSVIRLKKARPIIGIIWRTTKIVTKPPIYVVYRSSPLNVKVGAREYQSTSLKYLKLHVSFLRLRRYLLRSRSKSSSFLLNGCTGELIYLVYYRFKSLLNKSNKMLKFKTFIDHR